MPSRCQLSSPISVMGDGWVPDPRRACAPECRNQQQFPMRSILRILSALMLLVAGCGDPVNAPADRLWLGRGGIFYTQGLALDSPGTVASIDVDGGGGVLLYTGAIPC